jgi:hypothetical protein
MAKQIPVIGDWYQDAVEDLLFEVVAVDEHSATIEVQYEAGEVSEFDFDTWLQMILLPAEPPEDWRVSYELGDADSFDPDSTSVPGDLNDPLASIENDSWLDMDDF